MQETMGNADFFAATLGLAHPWRIVSVSFASETKRLEIAIAVSDDFVFRCPGCGKEAFAAGTGNETWFHGDFLRYETFLHALVPRPECLCCGFLPVERPWSREGSRFIRIT